LICKKVSRNTGIGVRLVQVTTRLDALTGLRFFAALLIVVHHLQGQLWLPQLSAHFAFAGGVSFFFVLSGFILHYNYRDKTSSIPWPEFMGMRFFRLWPAHVAALCYVFFLAPAWWTNWISANMSPLQFGQVLFLMQSITPDAKTFYAINSVSWSISTELFFYMAFPLLCRFGRRNPVNTLLCVAAFVVSYLVVAQYFLYNHDINGNATGLYYISPLSRIFEFACGIFCAEMVIFRKWGPRFANATFTEIFCWISLAASLWGQAHLSAFMTKTFGPVVGGYAYIAVPVPAFVLLIATMSNAKGVTSRFFATPAMVWLGNISFALYLVHQPTINFFKQHMRDLLFLQQIVLFAGMTVGVSALIFYFVEIPGVRLSRQQLGRPSPRTAALSL